MNKQPEGFERKCPICYARRTERPIGKFKHFELDYCLKHQRQIMRESRELYQNIMEGR